MGLSAWVGDPLSVGVAIARTDKPGGDTGRTLSHPKLPARSVRTLPPVIPTHNSSPTPSADLKRTIGFWGAIAVMIGVIIGSGIFRTPPGIAAQISSPLAILALWVVGGLICLAGALTYGELASMHPESGGVYVFLREGFGKVTAFVFGWAYLLMIKPFAAGGIAFVFAEHIVKLAGITGTPDQLALWVKSITTVMLLSLTAINIRGVGVSTAFAGVLTAVKFGALAAIVLLTFGLGKGTVSGLEANPADAQPLTLKAVVLVMSAILWTYDGWADVGSIAGEVQNPQRRLPRIYIIGTLSIIAIYVLVNAAYFMLVPLGEMRSTPTVAPLVMERLLGPIGAITVTVIIALSTLGSSHASVMTGARVSYAQARDGLLFRFIGHVHPRYHTPDTSLIIQVVLGVIAVWLLADFQQLAEGFVFTMWIFYGLAGASIFVLRKTQPNAPRAFRCPGYPIVPAVFVLVSLAMTVLSVMESPKMNLIWIAVLLAGVPVYYAWNAVTRRTR